MTEDLFTWQRLARRKITNFSPRDHTSVTSHLNFSHVALKPISVFETQRFAKLFPTHCVPIAKNPFHPRDLFLWAFSRQGATGFPLFTTWDSVAGSGRAPIPPANVAKLIRPPVCHFPFSIPRESQSARGRRINQEFKG